MSLTGHRRKLILFSVALAAFVAKCAIAWFTFGTNDVETFRLDLAKIARDGVAGLYRDGVMVMYRGRPLAMQVFSHPPAIIHLLRFWGWVGSVTPAPLQFWMRASCAAADLGSVALLWRLYTRSLERIDWPSLLLVAASPGAVMISGFHGNTDPIMAFFVLLSVYLILARCSSALAGCAFGLAVCVKYVPLVFAPAFLLCLPDFRARRAFVFASASVFVLAGLPYTVSMPQTILAGLFSYRGYPGFSSELARFAGIGPRMHFALFLAAIPVLLVILRRMRSSLFQQIAQFTIFFLAFSPALAPQYWAWLTPFAIYMGWRWAAVWFAASGLTLFEMYNGWAGGLPWYAGWSVGPTPPFINVLLFVCWLVLTAGFVRFLHKRAASTRATASAVRSL